MSAPKYLISIVLAATTLIAGSIAHAASSSVALDCLSYSQKMSVQVVISQSEARLFVSGSVEKSEYALTEGESIQMSPSEESSANWMGFQGTSANNQATTFRFQPADLEKDGKFKAVLNVSADWTDTMEVVNQMSCKVVSN